MWRKQDVEKTGSGFHAKGPYCYNFPTLEQWLCPAAGSSSFTGLKRPCLVPSPASIEAGEASRHAAWTRDVAGARLAEEGGFAARNGDATPLARTAKERRKAVLGNRISP